ncbi:unnamed protein product [Kuraishia capsulata CBS 1993]|uniref:Adenosine deaminase domain-containing protein n=1 Tax=Kuraishia capsulata CBS 1993 TaxID=1382522 RepID=W6MLW1_9ASCO|nr:uncharacterized protein KUCA_T00003125001 [Kuraishia capsulata CBS 1993]CDK27148.1 unnamed protein product [Kuraishia capsulata CBS 1993]
MSDEKVSQFIEELPKCEQHLHIEGTLSPERRWSCVIANGLQIENCSSLEELSQQYETEYVYQKGQDPAKYLQEFLAIYYASMNVLRTVDDFYNLALDYIKKANSMNVRYVEAFFDPQAHTSRGIEFDVVMEGLLKAKEEAWSHYGIQLHWIMCILRDMSAESAIETVKQSFPYKENIIGLGLDSDEHENPPSKFQEAFKLARQYGYKITSHCDVDQKNTHQHIKYVITELGGARPPAKKYELENPDLYLTPKFPTGADRIDHGLNVADNEDLLEFTRKSGLGLTLCPIGYQKHMGPHVVFPKVVRIIEYGIPITLNSDDPAYMANYKSEILAGTLKGCNLSIRDLYEFEKNAILMGWTSDVEFKRSFLKDLEQVYLKFSI